MVAWFPWVLIGICTLGTFALFVFTNWWEESRSAPLSPRDWDVQFEADVTREAEEELFKSLLMDDEEEEEAEDIDVPARPPTPVPWKAPWVFIQDYVNQKPKNEQ